MRASVLTILLFIGCGPLNGGAGTAAVDLPLTYDKFRSLSYERREQLIASLEPDDQIDAYLSMLDETEPPNLGLAWKIGRTGDPLVAAAQARLEHDKDEFHRSNVLFLLWVVHREGYSDIRGLNSLMALLDEVVRQTKDDAIRRANAETLLGIRSSPPGGRNHTQ